MAAGCSAPDARTFWLCPALVHRVYNKNSSPLNRVYRTGRETVQFLDPQSFKIHNIISRVYFTIKKKEDAIPEVAKSFEKNKKGGGKKKTGLESMEVPIDSEWTFSTFEKPRSDVEEFCLVVGQAACRGEKKARSEKTEFANKKRRKNYDIRCHGRLRMPRAIRRAKKTGTSCRFMTHGIDQSASWNAATPASRDRTIFATFTASAPHTVYRELRILDDDPVVPFIRVYF